MDKKHTLPYSPECKLEAAQLVRKQGYRVTEAAKAIGVSKSAMRSGLINQEENGKGKALQAVLLHKNSKKSVNEKRKSDE